MGIESINNPGSANGLSGVTQEIRSLRPRTLNNQSTRSYRKREDILNEDEFDRDLSDIQKEQLEEHVNQLDEIVRTYTQEFNFEIHEGTERYYVEVIDSIEDEIIREIPPEEILDIVARIEDMIGLVIDARV